MALFVDKTHPPADLASRNLKIVGIMLSGILNYQKKLARFSIFVLFKLEFSLID